MLLRLGPLFPLNVFLVWLTKRHNEWIGGNMLENWPVFPSVQLDIQRSSLVWGFWVFFFQRLNMYFVWCSILKRRGSGVLIRSVMVDGTWFHIEQNSLELSSSIKYSNGSSVLTSAHRVEAVCKMAEMPYCFVFVSFLSVCLDKCLGHALARTILCLTTQRRQRHRSLCSV